MKAMRESDPPRARAHHRDRVREEWNTRMAWSMVAAVGLHAAALVYWPKLPGLSLFDDPREAAADPKQPQWLFLDQAAPQGEDEGRGRGQAAAAPRSVPVSPLPEGIATAQADADANTETFRDRLLRSTSFTPTLAASNDPGGITPAVTEGSASATVSGGGTATLSSAEFQSLQQLSALDLERLTAVRPEVALEASSSWVLVRNPSDVKDFMIRHAAPPEDGGGRGGSVSVAL